MAEKKIEKTKSKLKKEKIERAKANEAKQVEKRKALINGGCFGKPCFESDKCLSCIVFPLCCKKQSETLTAEKLAVEEKLTASRSAKKSAKKVNKAITLSQLFYIACRLSANNGLYSGFSYDKLFCTYIDLKKRLKVKKGSGKVIKGFTAHVTNALNKKENIFSEKGFALKETDDGQLFYGVIHRGNRHATQMLTENS